MKYASFIDSFECQALETPHNIAISSPKESLSFDYHTLNLYSNKIAHYLSTLGISRGNVVGIVSDRTIISYVIVLAALKLRATIVPLDLN